jgi:hypothetical protein
VEQDVNDEKKIGSFNAYNRSVNKSCAKPEEPPQPVVVEPEPEEDTGEIYDRQLELQKQ